MIEPAKASSDLLPTHIPTAVATPELQPAQKLEEEWLTCQRTAKRCGIPCVSLRQERFDPTLMQKFPAEVLLTYKMIPIAQVDGILTLAMADPLDVVAEDVVRLVTGCKVRRVVAPASEILDALEGRLSEAETMVSAILRRIPDCGEITYVQSSDAVTEESGGNLEDLQPTAPIIQLVSSIIGDAIRMGASDIHVEPQQKSLRVRYRLDGYLRTIVDLPKRVQGACLSRLKIISGIDIAECRKPQDGRTRAILEGREVDLRVSCLPTYFGEKIVLRILDPKAVMVDLDKLGFDEKDFEHITQILSSSQGMILCTGPTGSGKTSTLYASLVRLNQEADNIVTVEDPVEYQLSGINQVQVNPRAGVTFESALRSILRQDPDIVLVGEIRDLQTAEIAVQAAQTGHLVLTTLHTNDAVSTVSRLVLMGIAPYLLASSLLCVLSQRLVRRLCPQCRLEGEPSETARRLLKAAGVNQIPAKTFVPGGCEQCNFVGYRGRLGIFEMMVVTDGLRQLLLEQASEVKVEQLARSEGMHSLLEDGLRKCASGLTSLEEILRAVTIRRVGGRRCPKCDAAVGSDHPVCVYCGSSVTKQCVHCKEAVELVWNVCPHCQNWVSEKPPESSGPPPTPICNAESEADFPSSNEKLEHQPWLLLVTPDSIIRHQISACILEHNYCLLTANDLSKASILTHFHMPDLILLDGASKAGVAATGPGMTELIRAEQVQAEHFAPSGVLGLEEVLVPLGYPGLSPGSWIAWLRSSLETAMIPVILLTEQGTDGVKDLDSGADSYLLKPIEEKRLLERIAGTLERNPRMAPPRKLAPLQAERSARAAVQSVPSLFTDPLRRALAAIHSKDPTTALHQVNQLAQLALQYVFSVTAAALKACGSLETLPSWEDARSDQVFQAKLTTLPFQVAKLAELTFDEPSLVQLSELASYTVAHVNELVAPEQDSSDLKGRLETVRHWLSQAQNYFGEAVHRLHGPNEAGEIFGVVQLGSISLQLDEPRLYLYVDCQASPELVRTGK